MLRLRWQIGIQRFGRIVAVAQRRQHALEVRVFLGTAAIHQIARHKGDVRAGVERVDLRHGTLEIALRIDAAVEQLARADARQPARHLVGVALGIAAMIILSTEKVPEPEASPSAPVDKENQQ